MLSVMDKTAGGTPHAARGDASGDRRIQNARAWIILAVFALFCGCRYAELPETIDPALADFVPVGPVEKEYRYRGYVIRFHLVSVDDHLYDYARSAEILYKGVRVYAHRSEGLWLWHDKNITGMKMKTRKPGIGADITGDGRPNLVIYEWTGGAHSDFLFHIFELAPRFRLVDTIFAWHCGASDFENLDDDPALELPMQDCLFSGWKTFFAASPMPDIVLKFDGQRYSLAPHLMRKPGLSPDKLVELAAEIAEPENWQLDEPPVWLWKEMLDLIYTGNMNQAWELFRCAWPDRIPGKQQFANEFIQHLRGGSYWAGIQELNRGQYGVPP